MVFAAAASFVASRARGGLDLSLALKERTKNRKINILIPSGFKINRIEIGPKYRSFIEKIRGGEGQHYVIYSVTLPQRKEIIGNIRFFSNVNIPEHAIGPLNAEY